MDKISPPVEVCQHFSVGQILVDILFVIVVAIILFLGWFTGIFIVAVALPFTYFLGEKNEAGWQMERLRWRWSWPWSNDYDGVQGQKNGKNYTRFPLGSYLGNYSWTALRNPFNNAGRFWLGIDYNKVELLTLVGTPDVDADIVGFCHYRIKCKNRNFYFPGFAYCSGKWVVRLGYKAKTYRYADRPFCGVTVQVFRVSK